MGIAMGDRLRVSSNPSILVLLAVRMCMVSCEGVGGLMAPALPYTHFLVLGTTLVMHGPALQQVDATSDSPVPPCTDVVDTCTTWAAEGECASNPDYMKTNCCKSCAQTPPTPTTAAAAANEAAGDAGSATEGEVSGKDSTVP